MICPSCAADNKPGRKFCVRCATPLALACPTCGAAYDPGDAFCGECGDAARAGSDRGRRQAPACGVSALAGRPAAADAQRRPPRPARRAPPRVGPVRRPRRVHPVRRGARRRGRPRHPDPLLRARHARSSPATAGRSRSSSATRSWPSGAPRPPARTTPSGPSAPALDLVDAVRVLGPGDPGPGRRPDRRGRGHPRRDEPGDGRRRPRQHRGPPPVASPCPAPSSSASRPCARPARRSPSRRPASRRSRASRRRSPPGARCGSSPSAAASGRSDLPEPPFVGRDEELRLLKDTDRHDRARPADPARLDHRAGRHRQEPARLGAREVHRRDQRDDLLASRPLAGLRRGDHVLGARRDGPPAGTAGRGRRRGDDPRADRRDRRRVRPDRRGPALGRAGPPDPARPRARAGRRSRRPVRRLADLLRADRRAGHDRAPVRGPPVGRQRPARLHRSPPRVVAERADPRGDPRPPGAVRPAARLGRRRPAT